MEQEYIIVHADKTVLKISGLEIKGMSTQQVEETLSARLHATVRVIGVTGERIEMDVYNLEPEQIEKDEQGLIKSLALIEGITVTDLAKVICNEKIIDIDYKDIPETPFSDCPRERWIKRG